MVHVNFDGSVPRSGRLSVTSDDDIYSHRPPTQTNLAEAKPASSPPDVARAWTSIGKLVQEYNDGSLARTTEDLNTLLVFVSRLLVLQFNRPIDPLPQVGLFSAAVSTLLSVSTPLLQERALQT